MAHAMKAALAGVIHRPKAHAVRGARLAPNVALSVLPLQRCLVRLACFAHNLAEVEAKILGNFAPAFAGFKHRHDLVEGLAR